MIYRRKIDYLTNNWSISLLRELYALLDLKGNGRFYPDICKFLEDPTKKTTVVLSLIPGGIFGQEYIDKFIRKYESVFREINAFCVEHYVAPLFPDPADIQACIKRRTDLLVLRPEEELNEFFGVARYHDYQPPIYYPPETEE